MNDVARIGLGPGPRFRQTPVRAFRGRHIVIMMVPVTFFQIPETGFVDSGPPPQSNKQKHSALLWGAGLDLTDPGHQKPDGDRQQTWLLRKALTWV